MPQVRLSGRSRDAVRQRAGKVAASKIWAVPRIPQHEQALVDGDVIGDVSLVRVVDAVPLEESQGVSHASDLGARGDRDVPQCSGSLLGREQSGQCARKAPRAIRNA